MKNLKLNQGGNIHIVPYYKKKLIADLKASPKFGLAVDITHYGKEDEFSVLSPLYPHHIFTPPVTGFENVKAASLIGMIEALKVFEAPEGRQEKPIGTEIAAEYFDKYALPGEEFKPRLTKEFGPFYGYYPVMNSLNIYLDEILMRSFITKIYYHSQLHTESCIKALQKISEVIESKKDVVLIDYDANDVDETMAGPFCYAAVISQTLKNEQEISNNTAAEELIVKYASLARSSLPDVFEELETIWPMNCLMVQAVNYALCSTKLTQQLESRVDTESFRLPKDMADRIQSYIKYPAECIAKNIDIKAHPFEPLQINHVSADQFGAKFIKTYLPISNVFIGNNANNTQFYTQHTVKDLIERKVAEKDTDDHEIWSDNHDIISFMRRMSENIMG